MYYTIFENSNKRNVTHLTIRLELVIIVFTHEKYDFIVIIIKIHIIFPQNTIRRNKIALISNIITAAQSSVIQKVRGYGLTDT